MTGLAPGLETDWLAAVGDDAEFRLVSRWTDVSLRMIGHDFDRTYRIDHSTIGVVNDDRDEEAVTLTGSADAWASFLCAIPQPPNHHILAMQRRRDDFTIDGRQPLLQNLRALNRALDLLRVVANNRHEDLA
jgi:hypothetical protein